MNHYERSQTPYPGPLGDSVYPEGYQTRRIRTSGEITWKGRLVYLTRMLDGELVGLTPLDEDRWQIWLGAVFNARSNAESKYKTKNISFRNERYLDSPRNCETNECSPAAETEFGSIAAPATTVTLLQKRFGLLNSPPE